MKRGFPSKKDALEWERDFRSAKAGSMDVTFAEFYKLYEEDVRPRLKENTWINKSYMIEDKLIPFFGKKRMCDISALDIIRWQNELVACRDKNGKPYKPTYLRSVNNQLNAIINHAARFYNLQTNPTVKTTKLGTKSSGEMQFWTKEERLSRTLATQTGMTNKWLKDQGLLSVKELWVNIHYPATAR